MYICQKNEKVEIKESRKGLQAIIKACLWGCMFSIISLSAENTYCFRVCLKDKGVEKINEDDCIRFLSEESIERRKRRSVELSISDVPIPSKYIEAVTSFGGRLVSLSKWMNTVVVEHTDSMVADRLKSLPMVDSVKCVWHGVGRLKRINCPDDTISFDLSETDVRQTHYGYATKQIEMLNGMPLHEAGRTGKGMRVAIIDAGFLHADKIPAFASTDIIGTRNIAFAENSVFCEDSHGTKVLSCMAANHPRVMVGTAPDASYLLIKSEDTRGEYAIEEDYYAAALEYADSVGVDVITSSLGYSRFDTDPTYTPADLNGKTAFITRVAEKAAQKGMLVICSAGNEGNHSWQKITFPADAPHVLAVGAVTTEQRKSAFSSTGLTADYRIKPDVAAPGTNVCVINSAGRIERVDGTSFSTPILSGLCVCLWQALPWLKNEELIDLLRKSSSQAEQPDAELGYGVPDFYKAYRKEMNGSF